MADHGSRQVYIMYAEKCFAMYFGHNPTVNIFKDFNKIFDNDYI